MSGNPYQPPAPPQYLPPTLFDEHIANWWVRWRKRLLGVPVLPRGHVFMYYGVLFSLDEFQADRINMMIPVSESEQDRYESAYAEAVRVFAEMRMAFEEFANVALGHKTIRIALINDYARKKAFLSRDVEIDQIGKFPTPIDSYEDESNTE